LRTYEALYIVKPDMEDDEIQTIAKQVESLITDNGGTIVRSEIWGKRKLAYEVNHYTEGVYVLLRFQAEADFIARLENFFRLSEAVIRDLVVHFDEKTLRLEEEQQKRNESQVQGGPGSRSRGGRSRRDDDDDDDDRPERRPRARSRDDGERRGRRDDED
jgi:small subunit ribosomal protein S6